MIRKAVIRGFTIIELVGVLAILSILAGLSVMIYRDFRITEYDPEGIAGVTELYSQAADLITSWGIAASGAGNDYELMNGCIGYNPDLGVNETGQFNSTATNWAKYSFRLDPGPMHWSYNVCFGYVANETGGSTGMEAFLVSASRLLNGEERVILYGSGIQSPIVGATGIPAGAGLVGLNTSSIFRLSAATQQTPQNPQVPAEPENP